MDEYFEYPLDEIFAAIEQEMTKEDTYYLKLELEKDYEDELLDLDVDELSLPINGCKILLWECLGVSMNKYICQDGDDYYIVEADCLHNAMIQALADGSTVVGEYTAFAHLFGE